MKQIKIPAWTTGLPDHTLMDSKSLADMFGYTSSNCVSKAFKTGRIPEPDHIAQRVGRKSLNFWRLGELRKLANEQKGESHERL